jgi:hypothetical protein
MDWAAVLGVSPQAQFADVRVAFRARARVAHPDKGGSNAEFQRIKEAYDAASRRTHRRHSAGSIPARDWDVSDFDTSNDLDAPRRAQREAVSAREAAARRTAATEAEQKVAAAERGKKRRASDPTPQRRAPHEPAPGDFAVWTGLDGDVVLHSYHRTQAAANKAAGRAFFEQNPWDLAAEELESLEVEETKEKGFVKLWVEPPGTGKVWMAGAGVSATAPFS